MIDTNQLGNRMREAMRLVRAGRLREATAAIQRQLAGHSAKAPAHEAPAEAPAREAPGTDNAQFIGRTYTSAEGKRRYKLFIPKDHAERAPLIVMLHGCTQTPADFAKGTRMNEVAGERGCFVVYPEQPRTAHAKLCWNWYSSRDQRRESGEPAIIAGLVRELMKKYPIDPSRVYVAGLSAGGAMAVILGRTHPELFAAVGAHSGLPFGAAHDLPSALAAMRGQPGSSIAEPASPMPTIVFHGDQDATVHPDNAEHIAAQAAGACNCDETEDNAQTHDGTRTVSRKLFTDAEGRVMVESWLIHGAAHKWSGGDPRGSHTDAAGPDASREMVRFFLDRPR